MHEHRLASSRSLEVFRFDDTFSIFHFLDDRGLTGVASVHRCFSLARAAAGEEKTLVWEELDANGEGIIEEENLALNRCFHDYTCHSVCRVSFWRGVYNGKCSSKRTNSATLIGYFFTDSFIWRSATTLLCLAIVLYFGVIKQRLAVAWWIVAAFALSFAGDFVLDGRDFLGNW